MNKSSTTKQGNASSKKKYQDLEVTSFRVTGVRILDSGAVTFDMILNGINIYGCFACESKEYGDFISFPQRKGSNGKYYSIVWAKLSDNDSKAILQEVERLLNE